MKEISREEIAKSGDSYEDVMRGERFHNHRIFKDEHGTYRWEKDAAKEKALMQEFGAKDLNELFSNGADKNDPKVRELYRWIGISIFGYWEVFYWEVNNEDAHKWNPVNTPETKEITITVSGTAGAGKSTIADLLKEFLDENGFDVNHILMDELNPIVHRQTSQNRRMWYIRNNCKIVIEEKMAARSK